MYRVCFFITLAKAKQLVFLASELKHARGKLGFAQASKVSRTHDLCPSIGGLYWWFGNLKPNSFMKPSGEDGLSGCWDRELACWAPPGPNHHTKPTRGKVMSGFSNPEVGPSFVLLWQNALHLLKSMFTFHCWFERETMTITFHLLLNMFYFSPVSFKENLSLLSFFLA